MRTRRRREKEKRRGLSLSVCLDVAVILESNTLGWLQENTLVLLQLGRRNFSLDVGIFSHVCSSLIRWTRLDSMCLSLWREVEQVCSFSRGVAKALCHLNRVTAEFNGYCCWQRGERWQSCARPQQQRAQRGLDTLPLGVDPVLLTGPAAGQNNILQFRGPPQHQALNPGTVLQDQRMQRARHCDDERGPWPDTLRETTNDEVAGTFVACSY